MTDPQPIKTCTDHVGAGEVDETYPVKFIVRWTVYEHRAEAKVYEASYSGRGGIDDVPVLDEVPEDASHDMEVDLRWDGCGNWDLSPGGMLLHTCGRNDVQALAELLVFLHRRAHELIPQSDGGE